MNATEKFGLLLIIIYFGENFPDSWKGAEIILFLVGSWLFMLGKQAEEWITAFRDVK